MSTYDIVLVYVYDSLQMKWVWFKYVIFVIRASVGENIVYTQSKK